MSAPEWEVGMAQPSPPNQLELAWPAGVWLGDTGSGSLRLETQHDRSLHNLSSFPSVVVEHCGILEQAAEKAETAPDKLSRQDPSIATVPQSLAKIGHEGCYRLGSSAVEPWL